MVKAVNPFDGLTVLFVRLQSVRDEDPANHQDPVFLTHLAPHIGAEVTFACMDPARLQRASEGTG